MVKLILFDKLYVSGHASVDAVLLSKLKEKFVFSNPKYWFFKKAGYSVRNIPQQITVLSETPELLILPIGARKQVEDYFKWYDIPLEIVDKRTYGRDINVQIQPDFNLEPHQVDITTAVLNSPTKNGLVISPPGSGKTVTILNCISEFKKNTLIIVHTEELMEQWLQEIPLKLTGDFTYGPYNGGNKKIYDITVSLIQSSHKRFDDFEFKNFGCVVIDETHHASSAMFELLLNKLPIAHKFGVTGTLKRRDKLDFLIPLYLGEILIKIEDNTVKNRITTFKTSFIKTMLTFNVPLKGKRQSPDEPKDYAKIDYNGLCINLTGFKGEDAYDHKLTPDEIIEIGEQGVPGQRNILIVDTILADIQDGHKVLALTNRRYHAKYIYEALTKRGKNGLVLMDDFADQIDFSKLREGLNEREGFQNIDFIVATEMKASEGLDIKDLSCLHLTIPNTNEEKLKQCLGRIRRRSADENKLTPLLRDYLDIEDCENGKDQEDDISTENYDYFERAARKRQKYYRKWLAEYSADIH